LTKNGRLEKRTFVLRDAMPATPSGKIQKFRLREMLREGNL
jgi:cyclohexanecarboxylate-CoA ligase